MRTSGDQVTCFSGRPRYEGANIRTWIGFKHFMYLAEDAVLEWFRERGIGPRHLFEEYGLGLEVIDSSVLLPATLEIDDEVIAEVASKQPGHFSVRLRAERAGFVVVVLKGHLTVALIRERDAAGIQPVPSAIVPLVVQDVAMATSVPDRCNLQIAPNDDVGSLLIPPGSRAFLWSWRARYFHCHFSDRVQHSSYIQALEEVVDRFLADRGISVGRMLAERGWIPIVSRARIQLVADAHMEETIHTTFVVEEVLKRTAYDARMDCYVQRGDTIVHTATARILHGYASSRGRDAGQLVVLDDSTLAALTKEAKA